MARNLLNSYVKVELMILRCHSFCQTWPENHCIAAFCRNLNYWDSVSTLAGEVPMPHKTFPKALAGGVVLVVLSYAIPLMIGLGVSGTIKDWKLGYFAFIAKEVSGIPQLLCSGAAFGSKSLVKSLACSGRGWARSNCQVFRRELLRCSHNSIKHLFWNCWKCHQDLEICSRQNAGWVSRSKERFLETEPVIATSWTITILQEACQLSFVGLARGV